MRTTDGIAMVWQKASIAGGLWASVEIIAGSFLHNLRVPFSGSILAFFGIILLVAFSRLWSDRGIIWRAGLICALMKSVSPSAVILGPMTGIFAEALLLQLFVNLFGRNLVGYVSGGIFSLMSALFHKIISLLILYGLDLFKIYLNIYYFAARQVRIEQADPWVLILILLGIYFIFGAIAAFLGYKIGNKSPHMFPNGKLTHKDPEVLIPNHNVPSGSRYSLLLLFIHLMALPFCLYFINRDGVNIGLIIPGAYCMFILFMYTSHLKRLKKPFFWIQIVIVTILAALFWTNSAHVSSVSRWQGIWVGLQLNFRAVIVIFSFTAISTELKNPRIQHFLVDHGFKNIYMSLNLAFSILPVMMKNLARGYSFFKHPIDSLSMALSNANVWLEYLRNNQDSG